jgi:hypothetical protein
MKSAGRKFYTKLQENVLKQNYLGRKEVVGRRGREVCLS